MNDILETARSARQKLATALASLQTPEAEGFLDSVAAPVARAMGALHQIESSQGTELKEKGPQALEAVREALAALQTTDTPIPALDQASEAVASSLSLVHSLAQQAAQVAPPRTSSVPPRPASVPPRPSSVPPRAQVSSRPASAHDSIPSLNIPVQDRVPSLEIPAHPAPALVEEPALPQAPPERDPLLHTQESAPFQEPAPAVAKAEAHPAADPISPTVALPAPAELAANSGPPPGTQLIEANLGTHSPTNFYKGLSGNDVLSDGGLFVATYNIPPMGSTVWLEVTMPGGYRFQAAGQVRWSRESGAGDAPPGFGVAFLSPSPEARQLIQRYVRNREPLFHDDL